MFFEKFSKSERRSPVNSEVTESNYVPQETRKSCGVAAILMARNLLTGSVYPTTVGETLDIMKQKGYPEDGLGRTYTNDRIGLVNQLNEYQDTQLTFKILDMPPDNKKYLDRLEKVLDGGGVVLLGFKRPYFELPAGVEVEAPKGASHGALLHGIKKGQNGERLFIVTDPEPEIAKFFGRNIEVSEEKLTSSLSKIAKKKIEVVSTKA